VIVVDWLLDSDPSIRWQVMRDLTREPADVVAADRSRVAAEGWGARVLARQGSDGQWGGAASTTSCAASTTCGARLSTRMSDGPRRSTS